MRRASSNPRTHMRRPAKDIDAYLAGVPKEARVVLEKMRKTIKAAAPKAVEVISYGMPAFKLHGLLVFFASFKDHFSFFPGSKTILNTFRAELEPFKTFRGTVHFSADHPLPASLVTRIVKARVKENEERARARKRHRFVGPTLM